MADAPTGLLTEDDEILVIEEGADTGAAPPAPADTGAAPPAPADTGAAPPSDDDDDDDGDDGGDARILTGSEEDDADLDPAEVKRRKRRRRREIQQMARMRKDQQIADQASMLEQMAARLHQMEQLTVAGRAEQLEAQRQRIAEDRARAQSIRAAALTAGDGNRVNQIDDIIRQIDEEDRQLAGATDTVRQTLEQLQKRQPATVPTGPQADVKAYASAWMQQNPWFNPQGNDTASAVTRQIDAGVAADGFRPDTPEYWFELTRRLNAAAKSNQQPQTGAKPATPARSAATPPPVATGRSVADGGAAAGPKTFMLSATRKQAMIEAGIWDDPVRRNAQIRAYAAYDHDQAARQK